MGNKGRDNILPVSFIKIVTPNNQMGKLRLREVKVPQGSEKQKLKLDPFPTSWNIKFLESW